MKHTLLSSVELCFKLYWQHMVTIQHLIGPPCQLQVLSSCLLSSSGTVFVVALGISHITCCHFKAYCVPNVIKHSTSPHLLLHITIYLFVVWMHLAYYIPVALGVRFQSWESCRFYESGKCVRMIRRMLIENISETNHQLQSVRVSWSTRFTGDLQPI